MFGRFRIYPPEHFQEKYGVDEVHFVDEVCSIYRTHSYHLPVRPTYKAFKVFME